MSVGLSRENGSENKDDKRFQAPRAGHRFGRYPDCAVDSTDQPIVRALAEKPQRFQLPAGIADDGGTAASVVGLPAPDRRKPLSVPDQEVETTQINRSSNEAERRLGHQDEAGSFGANGRDRKRELTQFQETTLRE